MLSLLTPQGNKLHDEVWNPRPLGRGSGAVCRREPPAVDTHPHGAGRQRADQERQPPVHGAGGRDTGRSDPRGTGSVTGDRRWLPAGTRPGHGQASGSGRWHHGSVPTTAPVRSSQRMLHVCHVHKWEHTHTHTRNETNCPLAVSLHGSFHACR